MGVTIRPRNGVVSALTRPPLDSAWTAMDFTMPRICLKKSKALKTTNVSSTRVEETGRLSPAMYMGEAVVYVEGVGKDEVAAESGTQPILTSRQG